MVLPMYMIGLFPSAALLHSILSGKALTDISGSVLY
jgi:hypothetical protein